MKTSSTSAKVMLISTFLWIGFVGAISFMEAWLKFQAAGMTLSIGLGIGRLVFGALNKMEWIFALGILLSIISAKEKHPAHLLCFLIPLLLLLAQTLWLLPALDVRAVAIINGTDPGASNLHFYYVGMEAVKIISLFFFGIKKL